MTTHAIMQRGVLLVFLCVSMTGCVLVTKHRPKQSSGNRNNKSRVNETVREKYTTGVCQEGKDDVTLYKQTHEQCFTECRSRSLCTSINFYSKVGVCRLNLQKNLTTKVCQKYIFSEKKNWKQKSIKGCENQQCSKTHKCVVRKGNPACFATGCENIKSIEHGVMFGNLVEVGKSRGFRCNKGYNLIGSKKITCQSNGQWSDTVPVCSADKAKSDMQTPKTTTHSTKATTNKTAKTSSSMPPPPPTTTESETTKPNTTTQIPNSPTAPGERNLTTNKTVSSTTTKQTHSTEQSSSQDLTTELSTTYSNSTISYTLSTESESNTYSDFWGQTTTETLRKDRIFSDYDGYCNTWNLECGERNQECRRDKCQCIFPWVYDPTSHNCVTGCTSLGSSYQQHDGMFISDGAARQDYDRTDSVKTCLDLCTNTSLCTFLTIKDDDDGKMICTMHEGSISDTSPESVDRYTSYLRNCGDQESGYVIVGSVSINGGASSSLAPSDENKESDNSSTDTTATKTDEITTGRSSEKQDPTTTDASNGALTDDPTTKSSVASSDHDDTSISATGDSKISRDIAIYESPKACDRGFVFCYTRQTCTQECGVMADTYQVHYNSSVHYTSGGTIFQEFGKSNNLSECLYNCTQRSDCTLVTRMLKDNEMKVCTIVGTHGILPKDLFETEDRMTVFVRDCEYPVTSEA